MIWDSYSVNYEGGWRWRRHVPPKRLLTFIGLHGVIYQKIEHFYYRSVRRNTIMVQLWDRLVLRMQVSVCIGELHVAKVPNYYFRGLTSHPTELQVPPMVRIPPVEEPWSISLSLLEFSRILSLSLNDILGHFKTDHGTFLLCSSKLIILIRPISRRNINFCSCESTVK
jgi:hypothetical protein